MEKLIKNGATIIVNSFIPFKGFIAMMLYGTIFWRKQYAYYLIDGYKPKYCNMVINHEMIHKAQMQDFCRWIPIGGTIFYILYFFEWIFRLFVNGPRQAYSMISFEQEAKNNEQNMDYITSRRRFDAYRKSKFRI